METCYRKQVTYYRVVFSSDQETGVNKFPPHYKTHTPSMLIAIYSHSRRVGLSQGKFLLTIGVLFHILYILILKQLGSPFPSGVIVLWDGLTFSHDSVEGVACSMPW